MSGQSVPASRANHNAKAGAKAGAGAIQGVAGAADWRDMQSGARFAQVLDEKLGHMAQTASYPRGDSRTARMPHPAVVLMFEANAGTSAVYARRAANAYGSGDRRRSGAEAAPKAAPVRIVRTLTDRQRQALMHMVAMGANLQEHFTARELRSAFRSLAQMYHPDRYPQSTEFEKAKLSRQFASIHEAYRVLVLAVTLPPTAA
jgi:hypothetical protein